MEDLYALLQVRHDADPETVQAAYRSLLRRLHPDKNPDRREWAAEQTRQLNDAYAVLRDRDKRRAYDRGRPDRRSAERTRTATRARVTQDLSYAVSRSAEARLERRVSELLADNHQLRDQLDLLAAQAGERDGETQKLQTRLVEADTMRRRLERALGIAEKQREQLRLRLNGDQDPETSREPTEPKRARRAGASAATPRDTNVINLPGGRHTMTFARISGGTFSMGSDVGGADERPEHDVTVHDFWMAIAPITCRQYSAFIRSQPAWSKRVNDGQRHPDYLKDFQGDTPQKGRQARPVRWVTWHAAAAFCQWAGVRLPTEAQWEYAGRGGVDHRYATTAGALLPRLANYGGKVGSVTEVRRFPPNPFGLYDMSGNVWEWCTDVYGIDFYSTAEATVPNPLNGASLLFRNDDWRGVESSSIRVMRGGSWQSMSIDVRTSARASQTADLPTDYCGFRCVLPA